MQNVKKSWELAVWDSTTTLTVMKLHYSQAVSLYRCSIGSTVTEPISISSTSPGRPLIRLLRLVAQDWFYYEQLETLTVSVG